jgi:hypothetical protein
LKVNARPESPGEIPKRDAGRWVGEIARRTQGEMEDTEDWKGERADWDHMSAIVQKSLFVIGLFFLGGCASSHHRVPSIDVFGSYFPAWLLSLLAGVVLTIIAASAGRLMDIRPSGLWALILSVSLILIFSISIWFWFFAS